MHVFSCRFSAISKNTFCYRTPLVAAFEKRLFGLLELLLRNVCLVYCNCVFKLLLSAV